MSKLGFEIGDQVREVRCGYMGEIVWFNHGESCQFKVKTNKPILYYNSAVGIVYNPDEAGYVKIYTHLKNLKKLSPIEILVYEDSINGSTK